jgi:23S rRNA pseudouridine955/2504/2580 synthase
MAVETFEVAPSDAAIRLDRWLKRQFPGVPYARFAKLLRTGQIRVNGGRVAASHRLDAGARIRLPPLLTAPKDKDDRPDERRTRHQPSAEAIAEARRWILYQDDQIIAINKPPGLAVQGGSGVKESVDQLLDALRFEATERPRLVHRLDRDTSGVLLLARSAEVARMLIEQFHDREPGKVYWAIVVGVPNARQGRIDAALAKQAGRGGERVRAVALGSEGKRAVTTFAVVDQAGKRAALVALRPLTGRTHQLRVHCAALLGTPILGDGKYGGKAAFLPLEGLAKRLHLHAYSIEIPALAGSRTRRALRIEAPPPAHFLAACRLLGLDLARIDNPFLEDQR